MSSINNWLVRTLKRGLIALDGHGPNRYIFESQAMADSAVLGRGVDPSRVCVVHLGVDTDLYRPNPAQAAHIQSQMGISPNRRIFFYSGHMEPRKGVSVIMKAANILALSRKQDDWHIVLCGNKGTESAPHTALLTAAAASHVTFAGYRADIPALHRGCYAGIIASTGWDSFTLSALEMQASGLPILASSLMGLREAIADGETGILFEPGNAGSLAAHMNALLDSPSTRDRLGEQARARILSRFTQRHQETALLAEVRQVVG